MFLKIENSYKIVAINFELENFYIVIDNGSENYVFEEVFLYYKSIYTGCIIYCVKALDNRLNFH